MTKLLSINARREALSPKSQRRAEEILGTAREVFSELGYEKTTTLEIAQRLGISEATVFTYFDSKRDLCMQVISDWYDEISKELEEELPHIQGTRVQLRYIVHKHLNALMRDGQGLCALVLTEGRIPNTEFSDLLTRLQRRYTAPLMTVLSAAQQAGEIRADISLSMLRNMVYGSMEHMMWKYIISGETPELKTNAHELTELLWGAFAPPQPDVEALRQLKMELFAAVNRFNITSENHKKDG